MGKALKPLAEKKGGKLKPAEMKFFRAVAEGRPVDFSSKADAENDPAQAGKWGDERALRADRIAELCIDPEAVSLIPHNSGIEVKGARIDGDLDLRSTRIPFPLIFKRCAFTGDVNLRNCKIWALNLSGSRVCSIDCAGSEVENGIFLNDFRSNGIVCLEYTTIAGPLDCTGAHFSNPGNTALDADGIKVVDLLLNNGFMAEGMVSLVEATIRGNLECNQGLFINKGEVALNAERLNVGGDVFLCQGSWGRYKEIQAEGFRAEGEVMLIRTKICGTLMCSGGIFSNPNSLEPALNATGLEVSGNVLLHNGFKAEGEVSLVGATIRGNFECNQGLFINKGSVAINGERLNVDGDVFLCQGSWGRDEGVQKEGFRAEGEVKLVRAVITGDLDCIGGKFCNSDDGGARVSGQKTKWALKANGLNVKGSIFLSEGFRADGKVDLVGTTIGGNLECNSGEFINRGDVALDAERVKVDGDVFLCEGCWRAKNLIPDGRFKAIGKVKLIGAKIGGSIKCEGASFESEEPNISSELSLYGATISRELIWTKIFSPKQVILDLRFAKVRGLFDDKESWPKLGNLRLNGLVYDEICFETAQIGQPGVTQLSWRFPGHSELWNRILWLTLQGDTFHQQPYEQLADVLRRSGRDNEARTVLFVREKARARLTNMPFFDRCLHGFWENVNGYGYRPWRALTLSVLVVVLGTVIFWLGHERKIIRERKLPELTSPGIETLPELGLINYPEFNALVYSLDVFVPTVDLGQEDYWLPTSAKSTDGSEVVTEPVSVRLLRCYMWTHIISGWILTPLLALSLKGMFKH